MKLNLLPTSVSKGKGVGIAIFLSSLLVLGSVALAIFFVVKSKADLHDAQVEANKVKPAADQVNEWATQADELIKKAEPTQRNIQLVAAMDANVPKYPNFFNMVRQYIPAFFRTTSIVPQPAGPNTVNLTITGVVANQDQYNDLVLALLRMKGASNIQRQAIPHDDVILPNILPNDMNPLPYKVSEGRIPPDKLDRLSYLISKGGVDGFLNVGNFGADQPGPRGAMPKMNEVRVTLTVTGDLQVPAVRGTLGQFGAAPAPGGAPGATGAVPASLAGGAPSGVPGMPPGVRGPGMPPGAGGPPGAPGRPGRGGDGGD